MEKDATQEKLEKLHGVLETERSALREVLQAARKAVDDLKVAPHACLLAVAVVVPSCLVVCGQECNSRIAISRQGHRAAKRCVCRRCQSVILSCLSRSVSGRETGG